MSATTASFPYIGSKISLISNVGIRYEGILYNINTQESTVSLQHVKSFGTEGRKHGQGEHPPRDEIYDFVVFKGKDIQDLTVSEPPPAVLDDPAIVSINPHSVSHDHGPAGITPAYPSMGPGAGPMGGSHLNKATPMGAGLMDPSAFPMHHPAHGPSGRGGHGGRLMGAGAGGLGMYVPQGGMGGQRGAMGGGFPGGYPMRRGGGFSYGGRGGRGGAGSRRIMGELPAQLNEAVKSQVQEAFDFEGANAKFDKSAVMKPEIGTAEGTTNQEEVHVGYNKNVSFFDNISCETLDREKGVDTRMDRDRQRQMDVETFGAAAASLSRGPRYRRGYRRGLGYRRGGRGGPGGMGPHGGNLYGMMLGTHPMGGPNATLAAANAAVAAGGPGAAFQDYASHAPHQYSRF